MAQLTNQQCSFYLPDLGFHDAEPPEQFKGCGIYLKPDPVVCSGFCWIFPVDDLFGINVQQLTFKDAFSLCYSRPDFVNLTCYSSSILRLGVDSPGHASEGLFGFVGKEGRYEKTIQPDTHVASIGISLFPKFYEIYLPDRFKIDPEKIKRIFSDIEGQQTIPGVKIALKQLQYFRPSPMSAGIYYESKILEIISLVLHWAEQRETSTVGSPVSPWDMDNIGRVEVYIREHYPERLSLQMLTDIGHMGRSKLTETFRLVYGTSIIEYIQRFRIEQARDLLLHSDYDIGRVAGLVGYRRHASFSNLFKQMTGLSPSEFRK